MKRDINSLRKARFDSYVDLSETGRFLKMRAKVLRLLNQGRIKRYQVKLAKLANMEEHYRDSNYGDSVSSIQHFIQSKIK